MTNIEIKRGRLTERIGDAEHTRLPNKNSKNVTLSAQVEEKRQKLEKLLKRVSRSKKDLDQIDEDVTLLQHVKDLHKADKEHSADSIEKHKEEHRNLRGENVQIKKQIRNIRNENETREKTFQDFRKKADEREIHHARMKNKSNQGAQSEDAGETKRQASNDKLRSELKSVHVKMERELKDLEAHLKKLKAKLQEKVGTNEDSPKAKASKDVEHANRAETVENLGQSNGHVKHSTRGFQPTTALSRVHFGGSEEMEILQDEVEKLANEIDEKEKEWMAVQDQISKVETSRTELTTKHATEHERKRQYEDRIDILELEPTPIEHRSTVTSHSSTRSHKSPKSPKSRSKSKSRTASKERQTTMNSKKNGSSPKSTAESSVEAMIIPRIGAIATGSSKQKDVHSRRSSAQDSLKSDVSQSQKSHAHLKQEVEQLEEKLAHVNKERENFSDQILTAQRKIQGSKQKIEQIRHSHDTQRARIEEFAHEKEKQANTNIHELTSISKSVEEELNKKKEELKEHDERIAGLYQKLHEAQAYQKNSNNAKDILDINADLVDWKHRVRGAETEYEALGELVKEAKQRNQKVKEDLAPVKPYFDEQSEYQNLKDQELRLKTELKDLKGMDKLKER